MKIFIRIKTFQSGCFQSFISYFLGISPDFPRRRSKCLFSSKMCSRQWTEGEMRGIFGSSFFLLEIFKNLYFQLELHDYFYGNEIDKVELKKILEETFVSFFFVYFFCNKFHFQRKKFRLLSPRPKFVSPPVHSTPRWSSSSFSRESTYSTRPSLSKWLKRYCIFPKVIIQRKKLRSVRKFVQLSDVQKYQEHNVLIYFEFLIQNYLYSFIFQAKAFKLVDDYPHSDAFDLVDFHEAKYISFIFPENNSSSRYTDKMTPLFDDCPCYACQNYTRAYLHHLTNTKEMLGMILLTM